MKKAKRKLKVKIKKRKAKAIRAYLADVNQHCAQLSIALRALADRLDDVRSFHLSREDESE